MPRAGLGRRRADALFHVGAGGAEGYGEGRELANKERFVAFVQVSVVCLRANRKPLHAYCLRANRKPL